MSGIDRFQRLSLLLATIGVSVLYTASFLANPGISRLGDIDRGTTGDAVRVWGVVSAHSRASETTFMTLNGGGTRMKAVHFGPGLDVNEDMNYTFEGRVEVYEGQLEIVVNDAVPAGSTPPHPG